MIIYLIFTNIIDDRKIEITLSYSQDQNSVRIVIFKTSAQKKSRKTLSRL